MVIGLSDFIHNPVIPFLITKIVKEILLRSRSGCLAMPDLAISKKTDLPY
jgi:hypothetical protein